MWYARLEKSEVNFVNDARFLAWYGIEDKESGQRLRDGIID